MKNTFLLFVSIISIQIALGQTSEYRNYQVSIRADSTSIYSYFTIDTLQGDTMKYLKNADLFTRVSKDGVVLFQGHSSKNVLAQLCGCSIVAHGYATERYRSGELKESGQYFCGYKIGLWQYYYKNGRLKKVEMLAKAYGKFLEYHPLGRKNRKIYSNGPYQEYYANGLLKVDGQFKVFQRRLAPVGVAEDDITYESNSVEINGEFWEPVSLEIGQWRYYEEDGSLLKIESHIENEYDDPDLRSIDVGCFWLLMNYFDSNSD